MSNEATTEWVDPVEFWSRWNHWLIFDKDRRIVRCHCGLPAEPDEEGYGDSIVRHLRIEALRDVMDQQVTAEPERRPELDDVRREVAAEEGSDTA